MSDVRFRGIFRKHVLREWLAKELHEIVKIPKCLDLCDCTMALPICTSKFVAKTPQMLFNTAPTCFEGPRGRKIGFRVPGPENRVYVLLNYSHHQYSMIRLMVVMGPNHEATPLLAAAVFLQRHRTCQHQFQCQHASRLAPAYSSDAGMNFLCVRIYIYIFVFLFY